MLNSTVLEITWHAIGQVIDVLFLCMVVHLWICGHFLVVLTFIFRL